MCAGTVWSVTSAPFSSKTSPRVTCRSLEEPTTSGLKAICAEAVVMRYPLRKSPRAWRRQATRRRRVPRGRLVRRVADHHRRLTATQVHPERRTGSVRGELPNRVEDDLVHPTTKTFFRHLGRCGVERRGRTTAPSPVEPESPNSEPNCTTSPRHTAHRRTGTGRVCGRFEGVLRVVEQERRLGPRSVS